MLYPWRMNNRETGSAYAASDPQMWNHYLEMPFLPSSNKFLEKVFNLNLTENMTEFFTYGKSY